MMSSGVTAGVYWLAGDARWRPPQDMTPLTSTVRADICIVGGGFTGLWAALTIKRLSASAEVVLVEREFCGSGAAGRNGGWVEGLELVVPAFIARFGEDAARWLLESSLRSMDDIGDAVRDGDVDCDFELGGGLIVATCKAHLSSWEEALAGAARLGREDLFRTLSAEEAQAASGTSRACGGVLISHAGSVQPALLAQGLRRLAVEAGAHVFESSPMINLERSRPAVVETTAGAVIADQVLLATGSWLAAVPELRRTLFIIPAHVVATAPSPELLDGLGWTRGRPFADTRTTVHYGQRTADDRMVFGRGGGRLGFGGRIIPQHFHDQSETDEVIADMHGLFPATREVPIEWRWGGPVDRAQHGFPWVGQIGRHGNVHYAAGYSGNGVGPSHFVGRTLASLALGLDDEYAASPLVSEPPTYLPPEPLRYVGARAVRGAVKRCEDREELGLEPGQVSGRLRKATRLSLPKGIVLRTCSRGRESAPCAAARTDRSDNDAQRPPR